MKHSWISKDKLYDTCRNCGLMRRYPSKDNNDVIYFKGSKTWKTFSPPCTLSDQEGAQGQLFENTPRNSTL